MDHHQRRTSEAPNGPKAGDQVLIANLGWAHTPVGTTGPESRDHGIRPYGAFDEGVDWVAFILKFFLDKSTWNRHKPKFNRA